MDPNLIKIMEYRAEEIERGDTKRVLYEAEQYLSYILCYNRAQINKEFRDFKKAIIK